MQATPYGWRERGTAPMRWLCAALGHWWYATEWRLSPYTTHTHSRDIACGRCGERVVQKAHRNALKNEQPDDALPQL